MRSPSPLSVALVRCVHSNLNSELKINQFHMVVIAASSTLPSLAFNTIYVKMWHGLSNMEKDPYFEVSNMAKKLTDYVRNKVLRRY